MELRQLEHFVAAAEEGHFSRAADRANIVQSGLSASIRALERELGTRLFDRTTRRVELTESGRALLTEARRVLGAAAAAREAVAGVEGLQRGTLSLGIMQSLGAVQLPALLARFHSSHPGVDIRLRQASIIASLSSSWPASPAGAVSGNEANASSSLPSRTSRSSTAVPACRSLMSTPGWLE